MATIAGDQFTATPTASQYVDTSACNVKQEIKNEPSIDLDETCNETINFNQEALKPKIRLTPTIKLMATNIEKEEPYNIYQGHAYLSRQKIDGKKKFVCPYENCEKSYGKSSHLRSHLTWHSGMKPFVCQEPSCGKGFTRSDELNRHTRTHTGEKPFECVQCAKKFSRSDHLSKHLVTHAKQMANGTLIAQKTTPPKRDNTSKTLTATACLPTITASTSNADVPPNTDADANELSNDEELIVPVLIPQIEIKEESDHVEINEHNEAENNDNEIMPEANAPTTASLSTTTAQTQMPAVVNMQNRPYNCDFCEKSFRRQDDRIRHRRTHTGEKPYICKECNRRFMRNDHLKKHMNTHLKGR